MKYITNLPYCIFLWWVFTFFIVNTEFYYDNFKLLSIIDLPFIIFSLAHFTFHSSKYLIKKVIFVICILCILSLQLFYKFLDENTYYFLYSTILLTTFYAQLFINGSKRIITNQA